MAYQNSETAKSGDHNKSQSHFLQEVFMVCESRMMCVMLIIVMLIALRPNGDIINRGILLPHATFHTL